jgi:hypothetical protein
VLHGGKHALVEFFVEAEMAEAAGGDERDARALRPGFYGAKG